MSISELYRAMGPIGPVESRPGSIADTKPESGGVSEFEKVLQRHAHQPGATGGLKFSSHAETRIRSRAIPWSEDLEKRVNQGIDSVKEKGSREALILAGDVALIANVKSRTIITAMDASTLKDRVFTNIDSAVIV